MKTPHTALLPAALAAAQLVVWPGLPLWRGDPVGRVELAAAITATVLIAVVLCRRRHAPVTVLAGVTAIIALAQLVTPENSLGVVAAADLVALFSVAVHRPVRVTVAATAALIEGQAAIVIVLKGPQQAGGLLTLVLGYLVTVGLGWSRRRWHAARRRAAEQLSRVEADRRQASAGERGRLARELHDICAHHLTSIVVTVTAAQRLAGSRPELRAEALEFAGRTGRETLTALDRLMAVLRETEHDAESSLDSRIADLVTGFAALGQKVTVRGVPERVDPATAQACYSIVREALTNTVRHAPGGAVEVRFGRHAAGLEVTVENEPGTEPVVAAGLGSGRGLAGMRERAEAHGGSLRADPLPDGGWRVRALLPALTSSTVEEEKGLRGQGSVAVVFAIPLIGALAPIPGLVQLSGPAFALMAVLSLLHTLPLLWRRSAPVPVLGATLGATLLWPVAAAAGLLPQGAMSYLALGMGVEMVALFTIATDEARFELSGLSVPAAAGVFATVVTLGSYLDGSMAGSTMPDGNADPLVFAFSSGFGAGVHYGLLFTGAWLIGAKIKERKARVLTRESRAMAAATSDAIHLAYGERLRIAEGLRSEVSHHTGAVVTAAQEQRLDDALTSARTALAAMRDLLDEIQGEAARGPQPTAAAIEGLCEAHRACGRGVDSRVTGVPRPLPPAVDVSAYRTVETALGAGDNGPALVCVDYGNSDLRLTITGVPAAIANPTADRIFARIAALGGRMSIDLPGKVDIWLPDRS
jgi:signal transduction histidine kinase